MPRTRRGDIFDHLQREALRSKGPDDRDYQRIHGLWARFRDRRDAFFRYVNKANDKTGALPRTFEGLEVDVRPEFDGGASRLVLIVRIPTAVSARRVILAAKGLARWSQRLAEFQAAEDLASSDPKTPEQAERVLNARLANLLETAFALETFGAQTPQWNTSDHLQAARDLMAEWRIPKREQSAVIAEARARIARGESPLVQHISRGELRIFGPFRAQRLRRRLTSSRRISNT